MSFNDDVPDERDGDADFGYDEQQFVTELLQVHAHVDLNFYGACWHDL